MKPPVKKGKSSDELASQRPKRTTCQKSFDNRGILWREETDLKKALYASLQETRKRNLDDEDEEPEEEEETETDNHAPPENGENEIQKKMKVHAQRKFAQGSTPTSPVPTPQKVPNLSNSTTELIPYRRPKTEDFLTFLCLRGTSILPPSLDFLNCCSKSDTSSECRSLSPDLDVTECSSPIVKGTELKEKVNIKNENVPNGISKKHTACKASSKRHPDGPLQSKRSNSKSQKEVSVVKKRKSRDENDSEFIPPYNAVHSVGSLTSGRTRASTFNALREKYKKQRLATGKKKNTQATTTSSSVDKTLKAKPINDQHKTKKKLQKNISTRNQNKSTSILVNKLKSANVDKKLAIEKRKSLRSSHFSKGPGRRKTIGLNKKTTWLRKAKLVPPIVDVDSESEPEVSNSASEKKSLAHKTFSKPETDKRIKKIQSSSNDSKSKVALTSRQILLRKHMQNRLKAKKSILRTKNIKSKVLSKHSIVKQQILRKTRKSMGLKTTMSLRKDHQNKRVTRSAKQQIEEMLWANPEKRTRSQLSKTPTHKSLKKRSMPDTQPLKKPKLEVYVKGKDNKQIKSCDNLSKQNSTNVIKNISKPLKDKHFTGSSKQGSSKEKTATDSLHSIKLRKTVPVKETRPSAMYNDNASVAEAKPAIPKSKTEIKPKPVIIKTENPTNVHKADAPSKLENKLKNEKCDPVKTNSSSGAEKSKSEHNSKFEKALKTDNAKVINKSSKSINVKPLPTNSHYSENSKNISKSTKLVADVLHNQKDLPKHNIALSKSKVSSSSAVNCGLNTDKESAKSLNYVTNTENSFRPINKSLDYPSNNFLSNKEKIEFGRKVSKESMIINEVDNNDVHEMNKKHNSLHEFKELNVQNNLNINKIEKTNDKDISKLMTLNVEYEESFSPQSYKPSTSTSNVSEIASKKSYDNSFELSPNKSHLFKKHNDKKYFKKAVHLKETKLPHKNSDKKPQIKSMEKCLESPEDLFKGHLNKKMNVVPKGSATNVPVGKSNNLVFDYTSDSDSFSSSEELSNLFNKKDFHKNETTEKSAPSSSVMAKKPDNEILVTESSSGKSKDTSFYSPQKESLTAANCVIQNDKAVKTKEYEKIKNVVTHSFKNDTDTDDSDCDLTIEEYLKLTKSVASPSIKHTSLNVTPTKKEVDHGSNSMLNDNKGSKHLKKESEKIFKKDDSFIKKECEKEVQKSKKEEGQRPKKEGEKEIQKPKRESEKEVQKPKKEGEKETQKIKKEGISSKHKKDKESKARSHDKSSKKDDKMSKKDPEKSLAKLLKKGKDRLKSSKKEEKSKHKRDGSCSSKSSKREFDKDGSKLRKESEKESCSLEKMSDKRVEFLEIKKDKSSKKESSKVSRSNSFEETKSPKKKKKYNEFKDIEKIKNLINNSSILNEISGFKAFKRRLSGDKLELKKRLSKKKQKNLLC